MPGAFKPAAPPLPTRNILVKQASKTQTDNLPLSRTIDYGIGTSKTLNQHSTINGNHVDDASAVEGHTGPIDPNGIKFTGSAPVTIAHGLGREPRGFHLGSLMDNHATFIIVKKDARTVTLQSSLGGGTSCRAKFYFY